MTKLAVSTGFGRIYYRNPWWKISFFVQYLNFFLFGRNTETVNLTNKFLFRVINRNSKKVCEIFSKTPELLLELVTRIRYGIFIVNFKHILYHISSVFISCFSQINVCWEWPLNKYMYSVRMLENI